MHSKNDTFWNIFNKISGRKKELIDNKYNIDKVNQNTCEYCNQINTIQYNNENFICLSCGAVVDNKLTLSAEWRFYGASDTKSSNPSRVGNATNKLLQESSLGSVIGSYPFNIHYQKIQKYHNVYNSMPYRERSLNRIFKAIKEKCSACGIPNMIIDQAKIIYSKLSNTKISRGSNRKGLEGTCVYMACKFNNVPRSAKEISKIFKISISEMTKGIKIYKDIMKQFNSNCDREKDKVKYDLKASKPDDYIDRFCSNLNFTNEEKDLCKTISNKAVILNIVSDNTPASIAAGTIFMISIIKKMNISKTEIAEACKISEVTISKCFKKMYDYRSHIIPSFNK